MHLLAQNVLLNNRNIFLVFSHYILYWHKTTASEKVKGDETKTKEKFLFIHCDNNLKDPNDYKYLCDCFYEEEYPELLAMKGAEEINIIFIKFLFLYVNIYEYLRLWIMQKM